MADSACAIVIGVDGTETKHFPANGKKFEYREERALLGGMLQPLSNFRYDKTGKIVKSVYADEEGLIKRLQHNPKASEMWEGGKKSSEFMNERYYGLHGPVLMVFPRDPTPDVK